MMQRASFAIAVRVREILRELTGGVAGRRVVLLVGPGDNGGDALWAGSYLLASGVDVRAVLLFDRHHELAHSKFVAAGGRFLANDEVANWPADVCLDGIFGIGGRVGLAIDLAELVAQVDAPTMVAIDLPSALGVLADITLAIGQVSPDLLTGVGKELAGLIDLIDMGPHWPTTENAVQQIEFADLQLLFSAPDGAAHKYQRGVVGVHAGSPEYPGAGILVAAGARHAGAGLVQVIGGATKEIVTAFPDVINRAVDERVTSVAVGSGDSVTASQLLELLSTDLALVLDAGALNHLDDEEIRFELAGRFARGAITVLTPHDGEAKRLGAHSADRYERAASLSELFKSIVVLKGPGTVISAPNQSPFVDSFGTSALATAGSGDVLAGLIAGVLARCPEAPAQFAVAGAVAVHGLAGRLAPLSATAVDIAQSIPAAYATIVK